MRKESMKKNGTWKMFKLEEASDSYLDLIRAPYVSYGLNLLA